MSSKKWVGAVAAAQMFFVYLLALTLIVGWVGLNPKLYYRLQMRADILPEAGISAGELLDADVLLAEYLNDEASLVGDVPFNEREIRHLADCRELFRLLKALKWTCAALVLVLGALRRRMGGVGQRQPALWGAVGLLALFASLILWGMIDFDSLFTAFHKLLFTNDLWLLDPRTDLLIRICPQSMFSTMAAIIAAAEVGAILIVNLSARILPTRLRRH